MHFGPEAYDVLYERLALSPSVARWGHAAFGMYLGQASHTEIGHVDRLIREANITERTRALELGAGSGGIACYIAAATGCRLEGLDWSGVGVRMANARAQAGGLGHRVTFRRIDVLNAEELSGDFDVVFTIDGTFLHARLSRVATWVRQRLRHGGQFSGLVTVQSNAGAQPGTDQSFPLGEEMMWESLTSAGLTTLVVADLTASYADLVARMARYWRADLAALESDLGPRLAHRRLAEDENLLALLQAGLLRRLLFVAERRP